MKEHCDDVTQIRLLGDGKLVSAWKDRWLKFWGSGKNRDPNSKIFEKEEKEEGCLKEVDLKDYQYYSWEGESEPEEKLDVAESQEICLEDVQLDKKE